MTTSFKALPTSKKEIADYARRIRRSMRLERKQFFPIVEFLEMTLQSAYPDMTLDIVPVHEMPFKERRFPARIPSAFARMFTMLLVTAMAAGGSQ